MTDFEWANLPPNLVRDFANALSSGARVDTEAALKLLRTEVGTPDADFFRDLPARDVVSRRSGFRRIALPSTGSTPTCKARSSRLLLVVGPSPIAANERRSRPLCIPPRSPDECSGTGGGRTGIPRSRRLAVAGHGAAGPARVQCRPNPRRSGIAVSVPDQGGRKAAEGVPRRRRQHGRRCRDANRCREDCHRCSLASG